MPVILTVVAKLIPLYLIIALGVIAVRKLKVDRQSVANLLIYGIAPFVFFYGAMKADLQGGVVLFLPLMFFIICSGLSLTNLFILKKLRPKDRESNNLLSFASGDGNTGYFGLPVALVIFGSGSFGIMTMCILGFILFESTIGYYIIARTNHSIRDSLHKVIRLPVLYAYALGIAGNLMGYTLHPSIETVLESFKGAYSIFGMMIIGMGLAYVNFKTIDLRFVLISFFSKFVVWPLIIGGLVLIDKTSLHLYSQQTHSILMLLSIVPLAANTVTFATALKLNPEKAATAVFLSTLAFLIVMPLVIL